MDRQNSDPITLFSFLRKVG